MRAARSATSGTPRDGPREGKAKRVKQDGKPTFWERQVEKPNNGPHVLWDLQVQVISDHNAMAPTGLGNLKVFQTVSNDPSCYKVFKRLKSVYYSMTLYSFQGLFQD